MIGASLPERGWSHDEVLGTARGAGEGSSLGRSVMVEAAGVEPASEIVISPERLHAQSSSGWFHLQRSERTRCAAS
jgi:hypothetical protein